MMELVRPVLSWSCQHERLEQSAHGQIPGPNLSGESASRLR